MVRSKQLYVIERVCILKNLRDLLRIHKRLNLPSGSAGRITKRSLIKTFENHESFTGFEFA